MLALLGLAAVVATPPVVVDGGEPLAETVVEELAIRLPEFDVRLAGNGEPAGAYRIRLDPRSRASRVQIAVIGPDGSVRFEGGVKAAELRVTARSLAVLAEGVVRVKIDELEALLGPRLERPAPRRPQRELRLVAEAGAGGGLLLAGRRGALLVRLGIEAAALPWLQPRLEADLLWPRADQASIVALSVWEASGALLAQVPLDIGELRLMAGLGPSVHVVVASTVAGDVERGRTSVHAGLRAAARVVALPREHWSPCFGVSATALPVAPELLWRGQTVYDRGAWQIMATFGLRLDAT